jgi:hypothetical protein
MVLHTAHALAALYETDETAWLEETAELVRNGRLEAIDPITLAEYLTDMSKRDRREVFSRLVQLLTHLLKWKYQPEGKSGSWRSTIRQQRRELRQLLESGTLRNHAAAVLVEAYAEARAQAADETGLDAAILPANSPWDLDAAMVQEA